MRVLQVIDSLAPGGAERSLSELVPHLSRLGVETNFVLLHDRPGLTGELRADGVSVTVLAGSNRLSWMAGVRQHVRSQQTDLVSTTLFDADIVGRVAARLSGVPCVSTLVNTPYGAEHEDEPGVWAARLQAARAADMMTARLVRRFRAVSTPVKAAYVEHLHLDAHKIDVIPEGRDPSRMGVRNAERRAAARASLGIQSRERLLLGIGRQEPQKGFEVLLRALPTLAESIPGLQVRIAGRPGRSTESLARLVESLRIGGAVTFLGHRDDIPDLLCAADAFVLPSVREGIPGVVQEAMALECPIVASDIAPVREALGGSDLAELFPMGDAAELAAAIHRVLGNADLTARRTQIARRRFLEHYDAASVAGRVFSFYEQALASHRES